MYACMHTHTHKCTSNILWSGLTQWLAGSCTQQNKTSISRAIHLPHQRPLQGHMAHSCTTVVAHVTSACVVIHCSYFLVLGPRHSIRGSSHGLRLSLLWHNANGMHATNWQFPPHWTRCDLTTHKWYNIICMPAMPTDTLKMVIAQRVYWASLGTYTHCSVALA